MPLQFVAPVPADLTNLESDTGQIQSDLAEMGHCVEHIPKYGGELWWVDGTNGNDTNTGRQPDDAFATIAHAIATVAAGDAINVRAGTYDESGLDLNLTGLQLWCELGVIITNSTPGTVLTISDDYCAVHSARLSQAGQVGLHITGAHNNILDVRSATGVSIGFDIDGANNHLERCTVGTPATTCFDIGTNGNTLFQCNASGNNGATRGFYIRANVKHSHIFDCSSIGNGAAGWETVAGSNHNIFRRCTSGAGDGDRIDAGEWNIWPDFVDRMRREGHEHEYPPPAGEGVASDPITIDNTVTDNSGAGPWSGQNYWGDVVRVIAPNVLTVMWSSLGIYINAGTAADVQPWQIFFTNYHYMANRNGGNIWDYQETVLTVDDAAPIETGDKVWITGTGHLDGEICDVTDVTGNVVTIASETRFSGDTGLKYNYGGVEIMYVVYRAGNRILHGYDGDCSSGSAKDSARFIWAKARLVEPDGGMIMRMANATDALDSFFDVRAIYED